MARQLKRISRVETSNKRYKMNGWEWLGMEWSMLHNANKRYIVCRICEYIHFMWLLYYQLILLSWISLLQLLLFNEWHFGFPTNTNMCVCAELVILYFVSLPLSSSLSICNATANWYECPHIPLTDNNKKREKEEAT